MTGDAHRADAKRFDHAGGPGDVIGQAGADGQGGAIPVAGHVDGKDMGGKAHLGAPGLGPKADAVDEEQGLARPRLQHPDGAAVRQPQGS